MVDRRPAGAILGAGPAGRPPRSAAGRVLAPVAWIILGGLALLGVLRLTQVEAWPVILVLSFSPWLYLLPWFIILGGALGRRRLLMGVAAGLAVVSLIWLLPQWYPLSRAAPAPPGAVPLRVFDANVQYTNPSLASIAGEIRAAHPDLITLEELSYSNMGSLLQTGVLAGYRWQFVVPSGGADGFGVWSDVPMTGAEVWFAGHHPEVRAWLAPSGTPPVRLYVMHTDAPRPSEAAAWRREMVDLTTELRGERRPLLVVGDFNATWDMYQFQDVLHVGLADAAVKAGKGWEMTWSRQLRVLPPIVRIDHVLYSPGITVTSYHLGTGRGSDHRPVISQLALTSNR